MIVADATTVIALALSGQTATAKKLLGKLSVSEATHREIAESLSALSPEGEMPGEDLLEVVYVDVNSPTYSRSESESLQLARQEDARLLLSDDTVLRQEAHRSKISCIGILGLLYAGHARGLLEDIGAVLEELEAAGYKVSDGCRNALRERTRS
jgi:predicted nucleic acid-binding protein